MQLCTFKMLMKKCRLLTLVILILGYSCSDIVEEDISNEQLQILSPPENFISSTTSVEFNWTSIDGSDFYNLTVVTPNFENLISTVVDSNLTDTRFIGFFSPGVYQYSVNGFNSAYESQISFGFFTIDSSLNVNDEIIQLISPQNNLVSSESEQVFIWNQNQNINDYRFEIRQNNLGGPYEVSPIIIVDTTISQVLNEGVFYWGVQGQSGDLGATEFSFHVLTIDTTPPPEATLVHPIDNLSFSSDTILNFDWSSENDNLTETLDIIQIFFEIDSTTAIYSFEAEPNEIQINSDTLESTTYLWRVNRIDQANNSTLSSFHEFTKQE